MDAQTTAEKQRRLREHLSELQKAVVAFSGGADSTLLLAVAAEEMDEVVAVTARAPIFPGWELQRAGEIAGRLDVEHVVVDFDPFEVRGFVENDSRRCYHCKSTIMAMVTDEANSRGISHVLEASQTDDLADYRPGMEAVDELGIISPLIEAGIGEREVRELSQRLELPTADLPSMACFASRIPYGTRITPQMIEQVARAEAVIRECGIKQVRVRHHGDIARIEVSADDFENLMDETVRRDIAQSLNDIGFRYVTADLLGYRTGSLNETLTGDETPGEQG